MRSFPLPCRSRYAFGSAPTRSGVPRSAIRAFVAGENDTVTVLPSRPDAVPSKRRTSPPVAFDTTILPGSVLDTSMASPKCTAIRWCDRSTCGARFPSSVGFVLSGVTERGWLATAPIRLPDTSLVAPRCTSIWRPPVRTYPSDMRASPPGLSVRTSVSVSNGVGRDAAVRRCCEPLFRSSSVMYGLYRVVTLSSSRIVSRPVLRSRWGDPTIAGGVSSLTTSTVSHHLPELR